MKFADIHMEIFSLFDSCYDKIGFTENPDQTRTPEIWNCLEQPGYESGNGYFITRNDS